MAKLEEMPESMRSHLVTLPCPTFATSPWASGPSLSHRRVANESKGVPTTQISLIREHTEIIKPPRALWVSFELGRPLGLPDNAAFQRRVLLAALLLSDFVLNMPIQLPENISSPAVALRFATQDLKAYYFESVLSRPDVILQDTSAFNKWFWGKTTIGKVLKLVKDTCLTSNDEHVRMTGGLLLVPMEQS